MEIVGGWLSDAVNVAAQNTGRPSSTTLLGGYKSTLVGTILDLRLFGSICQIEGLKIKRNGGSNESERGSKEGRENWSNEF